MNDITYYLNFITSGHNQKPKYMAFVTAFIKECLNVQAYILEVKTGFNLNTAIGSQLDVLGQWVGISRAINPPITDLYFSWNMPEFEIGWNQGVWKDRYDADTGITFLPDDVYRLVIKAKIAANSWNGTPEKLYELWELVFAEEKSYIVITDRQNMTADFTIHNLGDSNLIKQVIYLGYLPLKPAGVFITFKDGGA